MVRHAFVLALVAAVGSAVAAPPEVSELPGPLVLSGGKEIPKDALQAFFDLAGKEKAKIVIVPTAMAEAGDAKAVANVLEAWRALKPTSVVTLHAKDAKQANDPEFLKPLTDATGIWFANGHTDRLLKAYRGTLFEAELKKLHARGGAIGGAGAGAMVLGGLCQSGGEVKPVPAFGLLPGFLFDRLDAPDSVLAENASHVGLRLPSGSACVIRGRTIRSIGDQALTIRMAKGAGRPAVSEPVKAGALLDLYQLRRAAANRADATPFPPAKPAEPVVKKGSLVIIGGGGTTQQIMDAFFDKAGGKDSLIVVIPTTEADGPGDALFLRKYGATNTRILFTKDRKKANDPEFSVALEKAGGVWFGGGRQWRFVDSFEGTLVEKRCHEVLGRGGVVGGSSAGASIQSEYMPRGHPLGNTVMAAEGYERGFGFLPGCAVDQHFFGRKRPDDMTGLMKLHPQFLGIGIDEATAIVVTGSIAEVMGRSKVGFYDTRKKPTEGKDYEEVFPGEKYDLKKRAKIKP